MQPTDIFNAIAAVFPVTVADITGPRRRQNETDARHLASHLMKRIYRMGDDQIGKALGGRDRTTVIHGRKRFSAIYSTDRQYRAMADKVMASLGLNQIAA